MVLNVRDTWLEKETVRVKQLPCQSKDFSRVFIHNALSKDELIGRANKQTVVIIKEMGKSCDYRFQGERLIPVKRV